MNALHLPLWFVVFALGFVLDFEAFAVVADHGWSELPLAIGFAAAGLTVSFGLALWLKRHTAKSAL